MSTPPAGTDVAIVGGGLAGLSLAIQLRQQHPGLQVTVLERQPHPVPEGAFKVGESTVEIGGHYFSHVLGLREHLDACQIRKFGFRFFFSEGRQAVDGCTEVGVSSLLPTPSWQIDRGRFENFLGIRARELGVEFIDGAVVRTIELGADDDAHRIGFEHAGAKRELQARWLVDASGRAGLLKRKLGLAEGNGHDANAVWWRVEGRLDPNDWSDDAAWLGRCEPPDRWRSTSHLCGPGYWVWMIPLASGAHSLGIVCDAASHPLATMNTHDKAMAWLREHQPRLAASLDGGQHPPQDFRFLRDFSYGCKQVFSAQRWAITGEAGVFADPFYSPGSDFIAIANGYICDLVGRDRAGEPPGPHAAIYQQLYFSFYANTLSLYTGQYALFGDARLMPLKVIWDYTFYWSLLAPLYFADRLASLPVLSRLRDSFARVEALNAAMQPLLRGWGERNGAGAAGPLDGRNLDQYRLDWFHELNRALGDRLDGNALVSRMKANVALMSRLAAELLARARDEHPALEDHGLAALVDAIDAGAEPLLGPEWYGEPTSAPLPEPEPAL
jgi:flavin-dependent dehydrogenase